MELLTGEPIKEICRTTPIGILVEMHCEQSGPKYMPNNLSLLHLINIFFGKVVFVNNPISGLIILLGLFVADLSTGVYTDQSCIILANHFKVYSFCLLSFPFSSYSFLPLISSSSST